MRILLILLLLTATAYGAIPGAVDKTIVDSKFDIEDTTQTDYYKVNKKYKQKLASIDGKYTYIVDEYVGPRGEGYIQRVQVVDNNRTYEIQRHYGPETDRQILTTWTDITPERK